MLSSKERYYKLTYFQGTKMDDKIFPFDGGLRDAINEGRRHCNVMQYRFGSVRPAIVDLRHQEQLKLNHPDWNEGFEEPKEIEEKPSLVKTIVK